MINKSYLTLDILGPRSEPSHGGIVSHFLPLVSFGRFRNFGIFAAVNENILGHHSFLQHSHLRMFTSSSKQARRFNLKITDLLLVPIDRAKTIFFGNLFVLLFESQLFFLGTVPVLLRLIHKISVVLFEVAFFQVCDFGTFLLRHDFPPIFEEVVVEDIFCGVIVVQHTSIKAGNFLRVLGQGHFLAVVVEADVFRDAFVRRSKHRAFVLEVFPFGAVVFFLFFPPEKSSQL